MLPPHRISCLLDEAENERMWVHGVHAMECGMQLLCAKQQNVCAHHVCMGRNACVGACAWVCEVQIACAEPEHVLACHTLADAHPCSSRFLLFQALAHFP